MEEVIKKVIDKVSNYGFGIIEALLILIIGLKIADVLIKFLKKGKGFGKLDKSVQSFLISFLGICLKTLVIITTLAHLGIPMTTIITVFGSATIAIGLALQGGLTNMVGGLLILIFKPFKVGDWIETSHANGSVEAITIFYTLVNSLDNTKISIPNGELANTVIKNFSQNGQRRLCLDFSVDYSSDIDKVKKVLQEVIDNEELVIKDKEIFIRLTNHADSALIFTVRVWTKNSDFWTLKFNLLENVKKAFDKNDISIPFPQVDVHMKNK